MPATLNNRRIAIVLSAVNFRRLTPAMAPYVHGVDVWMIDIYRPLESIIKLLRDWGPAAIITEWLPGISEKIFALGFPVVMAPADADCPAVARIDVDDLAVGRLAAIHLREAGFRAAAFVGRSDAHYASQRLEGFRKEWGEPFPIFWEEYNGWRQYMEYWRDPDEGLAAFLQALPHPTGIFAAHDPSGRHIIEAAASVGLRVPWDLGVIAANDDDMVCGFSTPPLSSVRIPWERLAEETITQVLRLLAGQPVKNVTRFAPSGVSSRQSSSVGSTGDPHLQRALEFIRNNLTRPISVDDIAKVAGLSRRVLERRMQEELGMSPYQRVQNERCTMARQLLLETHLPIRDIAYTVGYSSQERFCANYRRIMGRNATSERAEGTW